MKIDHHPDDATIMAYAAGAVSEGFSLVLAAHMELCPHCRDRMALANALGGELMSDLPPVAMSPGGLKHVWSSINADRARQTSSAIAINQDEGLPAVLAAQLPSPIGDLQWQSLMPGIRQYRLAGIESGNGSVRLLSIAPGIRIPHHTHTAGELTLVLKGAYEDEIGYFKAGDLADLDASYNHQPESTSDEPCICLIATEDKLRFSGIFSRILQPLVGI
jgi:putative transcriptional regulator